MYSVFTRNCLTGAIAIFRASIPALSETHLPDGDYTAPDHSSHPTRNAGPGREDARMY
ncbi:hypothetical protein [Streptomyces sp. SP18CS02]|uniref:hypothetical protein n=1 Tax=Streptomyces sp. SP18CS02 TaxID=3002531 RepID=UPI002E78D574|nr:hypothetical protein [Streptomyces sp. SP18CS02]MEE1752872.1 hypothetical protein [Streptomyces sp. SP18CS02]